jgi:hypothetical protein
MQRRDESARRRPLPADTRTCRRSPTRRMFPRFRPPVLTLTLPMDATLASFVDEDVDEDQQIATTRDGEMLHKEKKPPASRGFLAVSTVRAPEGIRTPNLLIRSQMLYPLSYGRLFGQYFQLQLSTRTGEHQRRLRDLNPGGGVTPNRISSAAP